ncbi:MAG: sulfite exporter TauE/SafE family protein [Chloroflexota bacterium]
MEAILSVAATIGALVIALVAGAFGSVLGIGGGLFIVPSLTLFLGVDLKTAIATSIVAVIATSLGGGNVYVRKRLADIRLGLLLALATTPGAIAGALVASRVSPRLLAGLFAIVLGASALQMVRGITETKRDREDARESEKSASTLRFRQSYVEPTTGDSVSYAVTNVPIGVAASTAAGLVSGLLGVGGGIVQVPVMNLIMRVPLKVATTTSTYVIGITAMAGAFVYYAHRPSFVDPALAVPVALGVFVGASSGSAVLGRLSPRVLRAAFIIVLAIYTVQMGLRAFGIEGG